MKRTLQFILALVFALAAQAGKGASDPAATPRDFTFFMSSDSHIGSESTNTNAPITKEQFIAQVCGTLTNMLALVGQPYPPVDALRGLPPATVGRPMGVLDAGDLTDKGVWPPFEEVFPATGFGAPAIPFYLGVGNHDGPAVGPVRQGVIARNRQRWRDHQLDAISSNGLHYAWTWEGVHFICVNLCPADTTDSETPFKYGPAGPGTWNDPAGALTFLAGYLREHVGTNGDPVIIWQHYGYCEGFNFDWNWWTAKQRRIFYDAIEDYNVVALLHGHTHAAARYRWPDPVNDAAEVRRLFGETPPPNLRSFDVFSGGSFSTGTYYVFHILNDRLIAAHRDAKGWSKDPRMYLVKPLLSPASSR